MATAMVFLNRMESEEWEGKGEHEFVVMPRIGENIEFPIGDDEVAHLFEVCIINHPSRPASHAVDLYARELGETHIAMRKLRMTRRAEGKQSRSIGSINESSKVQRF